MTESKTINVSDYLTNENLPPEVRKQFEDIFSISCTHEGSMNLFFLFKIASTIAKSRAKIIINLINQLGFKDEDERTVELKAEAVRYGKLMECFEKKAESIFGSTILPFASALENDSELNTPLSLAVSKKLSLQSDEAMAFGSDMLIRFLQELITSKKMDALLADFVPDDAKRNSATTLVVPSVGVTMAGFTSFVEDALNKLT